MQSSVEAKRVHVDEKVHVPGLIVLEPECFNGSINDVSILQNSVTASHLKMECYHRLLVEQHSRRNPVYRCRVMIDNKVVSEATGPSKPGAKELACKLALDTLRKTHPVIKVHDAANIPNVFLSDLKSSEQTDRLGSNNIGMKMLQNMGWTGGGIGKKGSEGIKDPITVHDIYQGHRGLGHVGSSTKLLAKGVKKLLTDYIQSYEENDLVFSLELSKDERELVRQAAQKLGLKSQTKNRYLTIKRKQHPTEILHQLVVNGGRYGRYELISKAGGESQALNYKDKLESLSNSYPKRLMGEVRTLAADNGELLKYRGNTVACMRSEDGSTWDSRRQMLDAKRRKLPQPVTVMMKSTYGQQTFVGKRGNHDDSPPGYRDVLATQGHSAVKRKREREILPVQPKRQCSKSERMTSPVEPRSKRQHCKPQRTHTSVEQSSKRERSPDLKEQRFDRHQWECERRSYKPERTPDLEELRSERQRRESDRQLPKYERTLKVEEPRSEQQRRESERRLSKHEQTTKVEEPRSERQRRESERRHSKYERTPEREESRSERQRGESERRNSKHERTLPEVQRYRSRRTPSPEEPRPKRTADVDEPRTAEPSSGRRSAHEHKRIGSVCARAHHTR
ncbi:PREDICTED: uncharacterized protein LOC106811456 [Priapulus caudatus]|uniref:Uncharacterized protein LOC106811456 n=1 Tax=Priapulus caudatus TaxID=37621 RepID=A0ABM1EEE0_PRICU|nr:PREDICTED: uncharacterized protein LOC106811456 [Priapulus caudatus]